MRLGPIIQAGVPIVAICLFRSGSSAVGECMNSLLPCRRMIVILVGKDIFGQGIPKRMAGPSTIQIFGAMGFKKFNGGYVTAGISPMVKSPAIL